MKGYLKYFRVYFIIILALAVVFLILSIARAGAKTERANTECTTQERVFDYADKLTDSEEDSLRELIAKREKQTGCDIVLVTLNESLEEYAKGYEEQLGSLRPYQYTMVYADNFYDEHMFGYNKPQGDGVLLLDNWYRESDGSVYSWLSTCDKAKDRFSSSMIDNLLNEALEDVDSNPYQAYKKYVNLFYSDMTGKKEIPAAAVILIAAVATAIYIGVNLSRNKGRKTTGVTTYVAGGHPQIRNQSDMFLHKTVTKRHIQRDTGGSGGSGSGGGGGHVSSGGVSHGGGGHSR